MAWSDLVGVMDRANIGLFGSKVPITFAPRDGSAPQRLSGIFANPAMGEDVVPGQGTAVVRLFVRFVDISPSPKCGDTITINGTAYDVLDVVVDTEGGAILKLRTN